MRCVLLILALAFTPPAALGNALGVEALARCIMLQRDMARDEAEVAARGPDLERAIAEAAELRLRAASLKDTARVDGQVAVALIKLNAQRKVLNTSITTQSEALAQAATRHAEQVARFNASCSGATYSAEDYARALGLVRGAAR